jgi:RHS repeat-associated protein
MGRFTSVDRVEGGSANDYDYANQDPINTYDLDGRLPVVAAPFAVFAS